MLHLLALYKELKQSETNQQEPSSWAGAFYMPDIKISPLHQRMLALSLPHLFRLADASPESSVRRIDIDDVRDDGATTLDDIWYAAHVPNFQPIPAADLPTGCTLGMSWQTVVVHPAILLPWLRAQLEQGSNAVTFIQRTVRSLGEAAAAIAPACDVLINASGNGARDLVPAVGDERQRIQAIRGQTHLLRTHWDRIFMRQGSQYTYCIPRLDGTAVVGGVKGVGSDDPHVSGDQQTDIFNRVGDNLPHVFAAFPADFDVVRDNVGFRPGREGGPRVEKEVLDGAGLKVVHAYGELISFFQLSFHAVMSPTWLTWAGSRSLGQRVWLQLRTGRSRERDGGRAPLRLSKGKAMKHDERETNRRKESSTTQTQKHIDRMVFSFTFVMCEVQLSITHYAISSPFDLPLSQSSSQAPIILISINSSHRFTTKQAQQRHRQQRRRQRPRSYQQRR